MAKPLNKGGVVNRVTPKRGEVLLKMRESGIVDEKR